MGQDSAAERARLGNEIYGHPLVPQTGVGTDPQDGMPRISSAVSMEDSKAPPLEPETFVCMGDESVFVIRDVWGEELVRVHGSRVRRYLGTHDGVPVWVVPLSDEEQDQAKSPTPFVGGALFWFLVEPLREQCNFYRRVMTDFEGEHQSPVRSVERVCTAQRSDTGEYISLANTRVHACEHRSPRDFVSEERLKKFDQARVAAATKKTEEPWNPEAALEEALKKAGDT